MKIAGLSLFLIFLVIAGSCKKKDSETKSTTSPNPTTSLNSFTLKKDGVPYNPAYIFASIVDDDAISVETYVVYGQPENNAYGLIVRKSITPGTYLLQDGESENFVIYHSQDANNQYGWSDGNLTVLSNDTTTGIMHCTFDVFLYNDDCDGSCPHVTDGEMTIHY